MEVMVGPLALKRHGIRCRRNRITDVRVHRARSGLNTKIGHGSCSPTSPDLTLGMLEAELEFTVVYMLVLKRLSMTIGLYFPLDEGNELPRDRIHHYVT